MTQPATHPVSSPSQLAPESPSSLGKLERELRLSPSATVKVLVLAPLLLVAGLGFLTLPVWIPGTGDFLVVLGPVGLLVCGISAHQFVQWMQARDLLLRLHEHGFFYRRNGQTHTYRWEQAEAFHHRRRSPQVNGIPAGTVHTLTLKLADGAALEFPELLQDIAPLADHLDAKLLELRMPGVQEALRQHESVAFGPLHVSSNGLLHEGQLLPWPEFEGTGFDEEFGFLVIRRRDQFLAWARVPYGLIPNPRLFLTVAQQLSHESRS